MTRPLRYWNGSPPDHCDTCKGPLEGVFYDARTRAGFWAHMCDSCQTHGPGLALVGQGHGQQYTLLADGRWLKTGG